MNKATLLHLVLMLHTLCCCLYSLVLIFTFFFLTTGLAEVIDFKAQTNGDLDGGATNGASFCIFVRA